MPRYFLENSRQGSSTFSDALLCIPPTSTPHFLCGQLCEKTREQNWLHGWLPRVPTVGDLHANHTHRCGSPLCPDPVGISVPGVRPIWVVERWEGLEKFWKGRGGRPFTCTPGLGGLGWARGACPLLPGPQVFVHVVPGVAEQSPEHQPQMWPWLRKPATKGNNRISGVDLAAVSVYEQQ